MSFDPSGENRSNNREVAVLEKLGSPAQTLSLSLSLSLSLLLSFGEQTETISRLSKKLQNAESDYNTAREELVEQRERDR